MKNLKRVLSALIVCAMVLAIVPAFSAFADDKVQIKVGTIEAKADSVVEVPIYVTDEPHWGAMDITLTYDPEKLVFDDYNFNAAIVAQASKSKFTSLVNDETPGKLIFALASTNTGKASDLVKYEGYHAEGNEVLVTVTFVVPAGVKGMIDITASVEKCVVATGNGNEMADVEYQITNGGVNIPVKPCNPDEHVWKEIGREEATTEADGVIHYECEVCTEKKDEVIPMIVVQKVQVKVDTVSAKAGTTVQLPIYVTDEPHWGAMDITLIYDPEKLTYDDYTFNDAIVAQASKSKFTSLVNDETPGKLIFALASTNTGKASDPVKYEGYHAEGNEVLVTVTFLVPQGVADGMIDVTASVEKCVVATGVGNEMADVLYNITNGGVEITSCNHNWIEVGRENPTCEEDGVIHYECEHCDATREEPIEKLGHDWGDWTETKAATCSAEGEETRVCNRDPEHKETRPISIDPDAHEYVEVGHTNPTCEEDGVTNYECKYCDATKDEPIEKLGHDWGEWQVTTPVTCSAEGEETRVCNRDPEHTETRPISIDPNAHDWGEWEVTTPATCDTEGEETRVCKTNPEHKETRTIPALGHEWGEWEETTAPTCTTEGEETRVCKTNPEHTETRVVAPRHTWGEWTTTKEATAAEDGSAERVCSECAQKETKVLPKTGNGGNGENENDNPNGGDIAVPAIVIIALIASAAVVVITRKKRLAK